MNLQKAVKLAMNGKEDGYNFLYQETYQKSYYVALKYMKNEDDALDVLQDAYIKAFQNLNQLEDADKFPAWFSKIVASKALDELKRKKALLFSQVESEDFNVEEAFQDDRIDSQPELSLDKSETERLVKEMIDTLSDEQRICIMMYYVEEMSVKEMAETLGVSENTVKSRLNYGRKNIKEKVLELEKKGTKLYSLTPFPFFLYLLLSDAKNAHAADLPLASLIEGALTQGGAGAVGVGASSAGAGAIGAGASTTSAGATGAPATVGLGKVAIGIAVKKIIIGVAAALVIGGGATGGVLAYNAYKENATQEAAGQGGQNQQADADTDAENTGGIDNTNDTVTDVDGGNGEQDSDMYVTNSDDDSDVASEETGETEAESTPNENEETEAPEELYTYTDLDKTMYATQTVNVRNLPSTDGEKLGSLTGAQEVKVTGQCNETGWYRVEYDSGVAYVSNNYLSNEKPAPQPGLNADGLPAEGLWVNVCGHNLTGEEVLSPSQGAFPQPLLTLLDNGDGTYTLYMPNNHAGVRDGQMIHFDVAKSDELYWQLRLEGYHVDMVGGDDWSSCVGGYDEGCIHQYLVYK